jgi:hypothetical protein
MSAHFTDEKREKFLRQLERNYGNVSKTCRQMGVLGGHATVKLWRQKYPWFDEAIQRIREQLFDDIESNIFEAAAQGPPDDATRLSARKFLLSTHPEGRRRGYGKRHDVQGTLGVCSFVDLVLAAEREKGEAMKQQVGDGSDHAAGSWLLETADDID